MPHPCSLIKKELFLLFGLYDESFKIAADYDFFINAIVNHKVSFKRIPFIISVFDNQGISSNKKFLKIKSQENKKAIKKNYSKKDYYLYLFFKTIKKVFLLTFFRKLLRFCLIKTGLLQKMHSRKIKK